MNSRVLPFAQIIFFLGIACLAFGLAALLKLDNVLYGFGLLIFGFVEIATALSIILIANVRQTSKSKQSLTGDEPVGLFIFDLIEAICNLLFLR